jgi:hypothetical protein
MNYHYIHVPKTGGMYILSYSRSQTKSKDELNDSPEINSTLYNAVVDRARIEYGFHNKYLNDTNIENAIYTVRDPYDRFLSACRFSINHEDCNKNRKDLLEIIHNKIDNFIINGIENTVVFEPMCNWLGNLKEYKENESKVAYAFEFANYPNNFYSVFTKRDKFNNNLKEVINGTKHMSIANITMEELLPAHRDWIDSTYAEDFELYKYIQSRPYYITAS